MVDPCSWYVSIGKIFTEREDVAEVSNETGIDIKRVTEHGNLCPKYMWDRHKGMTLDEAYHRSELDTSQDLHYLHAFLLLLNCKNISPLKQPAPEKLNKKRTRQGKLPLFDYHVLALNEHNREAGIKPFHIMNPNSVRVHLCRGHFKEYKWPNLLFGKYEGLWWWAPHVRGNKRRGLVLKDYELRGKKKKAG